MGTGPPGESSFLAVRISTPVSVTRSVCSASPTVSRHKVGHWSREAEAEAATLTKLSRALPVNGGAGPVVGPCHVTVLAQGDHGLDGKGHSRLALAHRLVLGVMRDVGRAVEDAVDAVADVRPDHAAVPALGVLLDDVAELAEQRARLDLLDGLLQTLARSLHDTDRVGISLGLVADIVCLVQVAVVSVVIQGNV